MKNVGTNKEENSDNFIADLEKNFKHFSVLFGVGFNFPTPFPTTCKRLAEKTTKSSVVFGPFPRYLWTKNISDPFPWFIVQLIVLNSLKQQMEVLTNIFGTYHYLTLKC